MAYQSLYRRYRPQRFVEVRGQEHIVTALRNAVREGRVGHAYLFSGPRGTGKTTTARILAKALNCPNVEDGEPCGTCESCLAIQNGTSFDVHELDAASNNKVEEIRDLISKAALGTPGRTKVYILDEVHMLTTAASNALLKTLEEPPAHVVFVLATTDPQKVLPTIRSRTQHFDVHLLTAGELTALAEFIIEDAGLDIPDGTIPYVVAAGAGSARDMESALDQVVAAGGLPGGGELLDELVDALADRDTGGVLVAVDRAVQNGRAPRALGEELMGRLRDVFLSSMQADLARLPDDEQARVADQAKKLGPRGATRALEVLGEAFVGIQDAPDPRITLEIALVRITRPEADVSPAALLDRIERLEHALPVGTPSAGDRAAGTETEPDTARDTAREVPPARPADLARESLTQTKSQRRSTSERTTPKPSRPAAKRAPAPPAEDIEKHLPAPATSTAGDDL
ncbi:MAG: DNA polymerase III subunit gamma/tau, partial [Actinobacteria bacterium]|nr:DNA polymerase III subunit gamma/tau [Actinomycetota bacterium]